MSSTSLQEPPAQGGSFGSGYTLPSRQLPISDPNISKRVCFYKSGDYTFNGHRMVINARTFKTFDALLDALSNKVPLAFGVRTITTPRGIHYVKGLDDLLDGGSYVCSDQKRVKPINLKEMNRRQVPWNTTRPVSARRRRQRVIIGAIKKVTERVAIRTPKRLEVIKNRDPSVKRTIILQRRIAPTFDALLDYLSQILQFPVLKLYSIDGRRVDGLAALILCSGVIVAAGNEPFRLGNYHFHRSAQMAQPMFLETSEASILQPQAYNNKPLLNGRGSRNFSPSSERYIVNQINKSRNENLNSHHLHNGTLDPETSTETCGTARVANEHHTCLVPQDEDIEKSFRVNQDGSMTVEMKVRLTIKEEEMLHWTTTLSRTSLSKRTAYPMVSGSANTSPDSNNAVAKKSNVSEEEAKKENHLSEKRSSVGFIEEKLYDTPKVIERTKSTFRRRPTPGPRHVKKKEVKMVSGSEVQEMDQYTYMKRTSDNDTTEGYCVVRHSSSRSNQPVPKPRKTTSNNEGSIKSTGVAEVLQVEHNGFGVRETVMHIYETKGCYDTYFGNEEYSVDSVPLDGSSPAARTANDRRQSSSNDCDIDSSWQPPVVDSLQHQNEEILSLSSEPLSSSYKITNNLSSMMEHFSQQTPLHEDVVNANKAEKKTRGKDAGKQKSSLDKKQDRVMGPSKNSKKMSSDKLSNKASVGKKSSTDSVKSGQRSKVTEKLQTLKEISDKDQSNEKMDIQNMKRSPTKTTNKVAPYNGHNVNVPETKTATNKMKKSISDILRPKKSFPASQKMLSPKSKSINKNTILSPKRDIEVTESMAVSSLNPSPSDIHQYVEDWLEKVSPDAVPYMEEDLKSYSKVEFQLGADSEGEERNQSQFYMGDHCHSTDDIVKKSDSSLSVPVCQRGLMESAMSVSMPIVGGASQDENIRLHKSAEAINCVSDNFSSSKAKLQPVLRQICSSVQCISGVSDPNTMPSIAKSTSLPDFPSQVASVFGSSCKAFLSFLSMMTLRDSLTGFAPSHGSSPRISSEAMLMMESLQKISTIDNEQKQRASLSNLQRKASSQFKEQWQDYQIKREKLESKPLSSKISEFALDVVSQSGNVFGGEQLGISELMDELNMPADLRAEISSAIQQAISFYAVGENAMTESEQNQSVLEEEQCAKCPSDETEVESGQMLENTNQEAGIEEDFQMESEIIRKGEVVEEVNSGEARETENIEEEAASLKGQSPEDANKELEEENSNAKEVDFLEEVVDNKMTVENSQDDNERDGKTVGTVEADEQTDLISEKNGFEMDGEVKEEDKDQSEDTDSDCVVVQGGRVVSVEVKQEESQDTDQENDLHEGEKKSTEDYEIDKAGENLDNKESEDEAEVIAGELDEKCEQVSVGSVSEDGTTSKNVLDEALYLEHENSSCDEMKSGNVKCQGDSNTKLTSKFSSKDRCVEEKCSEIDTISELETEEGEDRSGLSNPVEISQELLDFVNSALLSSSLIFTYDYQGNIKVAQNKKQTPKSDRRDSSYGCNCLPSPNTSELTDYRPESLESGGYKTQESLDIVTESEDSDKPFPICKHSAHKTQDISNGKASVEQVDSQLSPTTSKSKSRLSSTDSGTKASKEDLSYFSAASSLKADNEHAPETAPCITSVPGKHSPDGVLIDHGRWLLKENHLIRRSPPVSSGMYGHLDNTSIDTSLAEDSPPHYQAQTNKLTALSSSELEEMARPKTPKCTYYNMPHGSDSDPFLDDASVKSGRNGVRDVKVAPHIDTTTTWAKKNGSLSSFASVEFKMPDKKVHPEGQSSAVVQARRTSSGQRSVVQAQDSGETLHWRCNQYCPIL